MKNRITDLFKRKANNILNIYFTAGFPNLNDTATIIKELANNGVDLIEIGMPYSDPLADGPTIQASGTKAIENGMHLDLLFEQIAEARKQTQVPLVMMGYFNQVMQYGEARFFKKAAEAGVDGLILPDLPLYEYEENYRSMVEANGLSVSFLITPQTTEERIRKVDDLSSGFIYMVSNSSITGSKSDISTAQIDYFNRINQMELSNPRLIGFGISDSKTYNTACSYSNGAIIGSAFIRALDSASNIPDTIQSFVGTIR